MLKETLDILIDALSEQEWEELKRRAETKQAFKAANTMRAKRESAIQFGDWILKHTFLPSYDEDGFACWIIADGTGKGYTSLELYNTYLNGILDVNDEDGMSIWDETLNDGLEELDD